MAASRRSFEAILRRQAVDRLHRDGGHAEALAKRCDLLGDGRIAGLVQLQRQVGPLAEQPGQRAGIAQGCVPVVCRAGCVRSSRGVRPTGKSAHRRGP